MLDVDLRHLATPSRLVGIDEAGRGALAGPLVVAAVELIAPMEGLKDSKKLSIKKREYLYHKIKNNNPHKIVITQSGDIDHKGLSVCIKNSLCTITEYMGDVRYIFDGNSDFGCKKLETLIKADDKIEEVMAASILAKVTRDNLMRDLAQNYPDYGFESHVGYGTKRHIEAIEKFGYSDCHRKSFKLKKLIQPSLF